MLQRIYARSLHMYTYNEIRESSFISPDCDTRDIIYNSSSYLAYARARAYMQISHSISIKWILRAIPGMLGGTGNGKGGDPFRDTRGHRR